MTDTSKLKASNKRAGRRIGGSIAIFLFLTDHHIHQAGGGAVYLPAQVLPHEPHPGQLPGYVPGSGTDVGALLPVCVEQRVRHGGCHRGTVHRCLHGSLRVISLLYNSNVIYIMQYMVMSELNLINTTKALILPSIASAMGLFLMRQSMSQVPDAMIEAAKVDGANLFTTCWRIVIPNQKPALMTMSIFAFQGAWNIQGGSLVYDEAKKTLPTVVQQAASAGLARAGVAMAAAVFMLIPPVVFFMLAQKNVIETMAHSGIKD